VKKTICVDFDGVVHSYTKEGWKGPTVVEGEPVRGAIDWLRKLIQSDIFYINIFSARNRWSRGVKAMEDYLIKNGLEEEYVRKIAFPSDKPYAYMFIDDRAFCFRGEFPEVESINGFRTWNEENEEA